MPLDYLVHLTSVCNRKKERPLLKGSAFQSHLDLRLDKNNGLAGEWVILDSKDFPSDHFGEMSASGIVAFIDSGGMIWLRMITI